MDGLLNPCKVPSVARARQGKSLFKCLFGRVGNVIILHQGLSWLVYDTDRPIDKYNINNTGSDMFNTLDWYSS